MVKKSETRNEKILLIGPFAQILTLDGLPARGPIPDARLEILRNAGVVVRGGKIARIDSFESLARAAKKNAWRVREIRGPHVLVPGLVDCHTHACFAGSRAGDYAARVAGETYLEIARRGGGILDTVAKTRAADSKELEKFLSSRCDAMLKEGVTTCEVKSGYGLDVENELKMLGAIARVNATHAIDLVPTCLAAHVVPKEYPDAESYLSDMTRRLLPEIVRRKLGRRVDVFIEDGAFSAKNARPYLREAKRLGFAVTVHADQFHPGGSAVAAEHRALSADHLEAARDADLARLKKAGVIAVALPGASLGLGMRFAPARKILDKGLSLAIASDFNPGSAPMGKLLLQAAVLGAAEKLTLAETLAGVTFRAAAALGLADRGRIARGLAADLAAFPCADYREILYRQGALVPDQVWKTGQNL